MSGFVTSACLTRTLQDKMKGQRQRRRPIPASCWWMCMHLQEKLNSKKWYMHCLLHIVIRVMLFSLCWVDCLLLGCRGEGAAHRILDGSTDNCTHEGSCVRAQVQHNPLAHCCWLCFVLQLLKCEENVFGISMFCACRITNIIG